MGKDSKQRRGLQRSQSKLDLRDNALAHLTTDIEEKLSNNRNKRKVQTTGEAANQIQKKRRHPADPTKISSSSIGCNALLADIKSLGGDEQDLKLINEVNSDDEVYAENTKYPVGKRLRKDLAALSKELGLTELKPVEASDENEGDKRNEKGNDEKGDRGNNELEKHNIRTSENLIFEPRADWHAVKLTHLPGPTTDELRPFTGSIASLKQYAMSVMDAEAARYRTTMFASSSHKFLATIMSSGTLTDKVSALTLACQESPIHNIRAFDSLVNMASKKSRAQAIGAIGALVDMLGSGALLPSDRRLRTFQTQPGLLGSLQQNTVKDWTSSQPLPSKMTEAHLISWAYEDWLKMSYFKIIQLLEAWCSDEIEYSRLRAIDFIYSLLKDKPEQESNLLTLLVHKLGDRDRKIASRASYLLLQLQNLHPRMKPIIVQTIEREILLQSSQDHRSKYYAVNTLNQSILTSKEPALASSLLRIYFELFVAMLKTGKLGVQWENETCKVPNQDNIFSKPPPKTTKFGAAAPLVPETEAADKLVSALLTGVNRAAPFVSTNDEILEQHLDTLFKIAHSANLNTGLQALLLIEHLSMTRNLASDRFYRALYESLLDPRLITSSKQALYLNLLLRALKNDVVVRRVKAFVKRMLQVAGLHQSPFVCGLLYVVSHLQQKFPNLSTLIDLPEESHENEIQDNRHYDGRKRHPEYSNAHKSCLWEMIPVQSHFHPSVNKFAHALLSMNLRLVKPDLGHHSLIRFLDKFVYRNAKSIHAGRGASIMQPLMAAKDISNTWIGSDGVGSTTQVNTADFWNKKIEDVAVEDAFFHQYFQHNYKEPKEPEESKRLAGENDEEIIEEDEIWQALVETQPDIDEDGSDVNFDNLDEPEAASEDRSSSVLSLQSYSDDAISVVSVDEGEEIGSNGKMACEVGDKQQEKVKSEGEDKRKALRKMLKGLPTFASVDDYAELLAREEEN